MGSSDTKGFSRMKKNQLRYPCLPSEERGAFPELLSCSVRVLQAPCRSHVSEHTSCCGSPAACQAGYLHSLQAAWVLRRPVPCAGTRGDAGSFSVCAFSFFPDNLPHVQKLKLRLVLAQERTQYLSCSSPASTETDECMAW